MPTSPTRSLLARLLLAVVPVTLLVVGAELAARALWEPADALGDDYGLPPHPTRMWGLPPGARFGGAPGDPRIGPDGLREVQRTGAELRVLTLGDSGIFGHGLRDDQTLHASLRRALAAHDVDVDVFCGGVPGYSILQSRLLLEEVGWALSPDLLVVGNLLSDSAQERFRDDQVLAALARPDRQLRDSLLRRSQALQWLSLTLWPPTNAERNISWARSPGGLPAARVPVAVYRQALEDLVEEAGERGVDVAFLELATTDMLEGEADARDWREAQRAVAREHGLPHVQGAQALQAAGLTGEQAFLDPVHVNGRGNQAYADALAEALVGAGWPEGR